MPALAYEAYERLRVSFPVISISFGPWQGLKEVPSPEKSIFLEMNKRLKVDTFSCEKHSVRHSILEGEHLEIICRALDIYVRMHVSREQDAAFAYGRPEDRHADLLLCSCESGAEHFDLLIPTVSPNLPKAFKIKATYFRDILDGQKKVEFRTDTEKLRKMLRGEDYITLQLGYAAASECPYMIVRIDRVAWDMPEDTLRNWGINDVPVKGRIAFIYIRSIEEVWYPKTLRRTGVNFL